MFWTHIYDLLVKIIALLLPVIIFSATFSINHGMVMIIVCLISGIVFYILFLRTLGSYLYCRLALKMNIDLKQAKTLNDALAPNPFPFTNLKWLPLTEVKGLNDEDKYETAALLLSNWKNEKLKDREEQIEQSKNNSAIIKRLEILSVTLVITCLGTTYLQLPPATFVIRFYCSFFSNRHLFSDVSWGCHDNYLPHANNIHQKAP